MTPDAYERLLRAFNQALLDRDLAAQVRLRALIAAHSVTER